MNKKTIFIILVGIVIVLIAVGIFLYSGEPISDLTEEGTTPVQTESETPTEEATATPTAEDPSETSAETPGAEHPNSVLALFWMKNIAERQKRDIFKVRILFLLEFPLKFELNLLKTRVNLLAWALIYRKERKYTLLLIV